MHGSRHIKEFNANLEKFGFSSHLLRQWLSLQEIYASEGTLFIEFEADQEQESFIRCLLESQSKQNTGALGQNDSGSRVNENLRSYFQNRSAKKNSRLQRLVRKDLKLSGFLLPVINIPYFVSQERNQLGFLHFMLQHQPVKKILDRVAQGSEYLNENSEYIVFEAMLSFFSFYIVFLSSVREEAFELDKAQLWSAKFFNVKDKFGVEMPSVLLIYFLLLFLEAKVLNGGSNLKDISKKIERSKVEIQDFFSSHWKHLDSFKKFDKESSEGFIKMIKSDFFRVFESDFEKLKIQEMLDNASGLRLIDMLSLDIRMDYDPDNTMSIKEKMKSLFRKRSLLSVLKEVDDFFEDESEIKFQASPLPLILKGRRKWWTLSESEIERLTLAIDSLESNDSAIVNTKVRERYLAHLQNIANRLLGPFICFEQNNGQLLPRVNLLEGKAINVCLGVYEERRKLRLAERSRYDEALKHLRQLKDLGEITRYSLSIEPFYSESLRRKWSSSINNQKALISEKNKFLNLKMKEYGIADDDLVSQYRKNVWLNEILSIHEEVKPFINYVKKAFQNALPARKDIKFDAYRHSHDGVEFDPLTAFDLEKWSKAEVMKTMKYSVGLGEVAQINSFCLDYSGSMDHNRMRNLFKILYLLILGLEDRLSYDSIHFFSNNFIECVNFDNIYTSRSMVFRVIKQITVIKNGKVLYGGNGGTNISEGINRCHAEVQEFGDRISSLYPEQNIVKSIFVITDGEPSLGIVDVPKLGDFVEVKRMDGHVKIKGIYIKPKEDQSDFISRIFGANNYVVATDFKEAVNNFVSIMTNTYKVQRSDYKWRKKRQKIYGKN